jgi:hypothetical protein
MLRFKTFIAEGGNITFGKKGDADAPTAAPFPVTAATRDKTRSDIHDALSSIHNSFHKQTGEHLFGKDRQRLHDATAYTGSTHDLMGNHISHEDFAKHKPMVGDIDVQVSHTHKDVLATHLKPGQKHGKFTVVGVKKHGSETSIGLKHKDTGHIHQIDFQGVHTPGSEADRFLHSSDWNDTKAGIKGAHHKILLNAIGGEKHKFSITHGLRSRTDDSDPGVQHPRDISNKLFGAKADPEQIKSFHGVTQLIKKHTPKEQHQAIYDKFKSSLPGKNDMNHGPALEHLRKHLDVKDTVNESTLNEDAEQHAHVAFMGASPHTHMGHHIDVVGGMGAGKKYVGLSGKSDVFSDKEREDIANKQSEGTAKFKVEKSAGQTVGRAFHGMKGTGKKVLHLHFGHDRKEMAERLKSSIEAGKIPELGGEKPHRVEIHYPKDEDRSHGMSGTKMRTAATEGDMATYKKHLGSSFSDKEAKNIMDRTKVGLMAGKIKVKR